MIKAFNSIKNLFRPLKSEAANLALTPRKYKVSRPVELGRFWVNDDPFATAFFNSLSVSFPHAEIFMIDSIKAWREHLSPELQKDVKIFIEQELNHSREHVAFNRGMANAGYEIATLEKDVVRLLKEINLKDDLFRLRATMCMEHLTAVISSEILSNPKHLEGAEAELKKMWIWHGTEEVEHKGVAYNVWSEVTKDWSGLRKYLSRSLFFIGLSYKFMRNRTLTQIYLLEQDGYSRRDALFGMIRYMFGKGGLIRNAIGPWAQFFKPNFHPWQIDDRHLIAAGESEFMLDVHPKTDEKSKKTAPPKLSKAA